MWRAIDGISKNVQELDQRDADTEDEEDTKPLPIVENPAKEELVLAKTSAIAQPILEKILLA